MQADPVDYGEWKTGIQATGTLSSLNGFLGKAAQAAAGESPVCFLRGERMIRRRLRRQQKR